MLREYGPFFRILKHSMAHIIIKQLQRKGHKKSLGPEKLQVFVVPGPPASLF